MQRVHRPWLFTVLLTALAGLASSGCVSTTAPSVSRGDEPVVDQLGQTMVRYTDDQLEAIVDYGYAAQSVSEEWLIVNLGVAGQTGRAVQVRRDSIFVRTPDGTRIPLPTQEEFAEAYAEVQSASRRAAIASDPLPFRRGDRRDCSLDFLRLPGTGATKTAVFTNMRDMCAGLLYFPIPGGVQPGRWELVIKLEEREVRVPFRIEP